jgi:hypothetical protein
MESQICRGNTVGLPVMNQIDVERSPDNVQVHAIALVLVIHHLTG